MLSAWCKAESEGPVVTGTGQWAGGESHSFGRLQGDIRSLPLTWSYRQVAHAVHGVHRCLLFSRSLVLSLSVYLFLSLCFSFSSLSYYFSPCIFSRVSWLVWILRFLKQIENCVPFSECGLSFILFVPMLFSSCEWKVSLNCFNVLS